MTDEMHNSRNQFLFQIFLSAAQVSNETIRSSSGAQRNSKHLEQTKKNFWNKN